MATISTSELPQIDWNATGKDLILQNVCNLISTRQYEVAYDRGRGIDPDLLDRPAGEVLGEYTNEVQELLSIYEPRATLADVSVGDDGNYLVQVTI